MRNAGEKAMALVDGQLAPAEVPALVQELARNAPLVAELQRYLALSRSRIGAVYAAKADEAVPARLIDTVMQAPALASRPPQQSAFVRGLLWLRRSYRVPAWSFAAAPALAVLALLAVYFAALDTGRVLLADPGLAMALDKTESGKDSALAMLRPVLSFQSKTAGWCRQYELRYPNKQVSHALACRGGDEHWSVVASTPPGPAGRLTPASADRRKAIDDLVTSMMRDGPLSQTDETAAIGRGWR